MIAARPVLLDVTILTPPKGKGRPRMTRSGRVYTPAATLAFERHIAREVRKVIAEPAIGVLGLEVDAYFARPSRPRRDHPVRSGPAVAFPLGMGGSHYPDADNVLKAVCDSLNGVAYLDDAQLHDVSCRRWWADEAAPSSLRVVVWRVR